MESKCVIFKSENSGKFLWTAHARGRGSKLISESFELELGGELIPAGIRLHVAGNSHGNTNVAAFAKQFGNVGLIRGIEFVSPGNVAEIGAQNRAHIVLRVD